MELEIKELEYKNREFQKELKEQYRLFEIAKKREIWYIHNKLSFTKDLTKEYNDLTNKFLNQIKFLEESIEQNYITIDNIKTDTIYILEKIETQRKYNSEYWKNIKSKKLYNKRHQPIKTEVIRDILYKSIDSVDINNSIKTCFIDRNNKHIVEL